jgi:hypothetical protein
VVRVLNSHHSNVLPTLKTVFADLISDCRNHKHAFRENAIWKHALLVVKILSTLFLLAVRFEGSNMMQLSNVLRQTLEVIHPIKGADTDYPLDMWLLGLFWGQVLPCLCLERGAFPLLPSARDVFLKVVEAHFPSMFLSWLGCLGSIYVVPEVIKDIRFHDFHTCMLSEALLQRNAASKCLFSVSCLRLARLTSYSASALAHFNMSECMLCLYHILLSCSVSVNLRPNTEKSKLKSLCKPIRDVLERYVALRALINNC